MVTNRQQRDIHEAMKGRVCKAFACSYILHKCDAEVSSCACKGDAEGRSENNFDISPCSSLMGGGWVHGTAREWAQVEGDPAYYYKI